MASAILVTATAPLSKVLLTPVRTSKLSLPALFTSSKAPLKSPLKTFLTALANNPKVSKKLSNRSCMFLLKALAKSSKDCLGFSNKDLKKSTTPLVLPTIKFTKSFKAIDKTSNEVLKKSETF